MQTKLTLRLEERLVRITEAEARRRGTSVSRVVADYLESLEQRPRPRTPLPPVTASLIGVPEGRPVSEEDYRRHLREKHL